MEDATIQKPWIYTFFRGTKVAKLVSYIKLEFNLWRFQTSRSVFLYAQIHFFKCEITALIVGSFETILSVNVTKEKQF